MFMENIDSGRLKNDKHELFCLEYLKDLNASQAAVRAGYGTKYAKQTAYKLLKRDDIRQRITQLKEERIRAARIDANYVLKRLLTIDQLNVRDLLDENGDLKDVQEWTEDWQTSIQALDIQVSTTGGVRTLTKKVKLPDRLRNLEMLGKHIDVSAFKEKENGSASSDPTAIVVEVVSQEAKEGIERLKQKLAEE